MYLNKINLIRHIENYATTGHIHDELIPFYDQDGKWCGAPIFWLYAKTITRLKIIQSSYLPPSRRTLKDIHGTRLRTSFIWRGNEDVHMTYSEISGSLIVEGNANIHASCLRHVRGSLNSSTNKNVYLPNLTTVGSHLQLMQTFEVKIPRLRHVGGRTQILGQFPPRLETVGRSLGVYWCFRAESLSLRSVGDYICLTKAETIRLPVLERIGGSLLLTLLVKSVDVPKLETIGGDFMAPCAEHIRARALQSVGGNVDTSSAKGFYNARIRVRGEWITYPGDVEEWHRNEAARRALKQKDILL
jgi:hypothetical protein